MHALRLKLTLVLAVSVASAGAFADPNPAPANLGIEVTGTDVSLSWIAPDPGSGNTQVRLLRRLNAPPAGPDDPSADVLFAGPATLYEHAIADLLPDISGSAHVYHYAVYGCDPSGAVCEGTGSHASLAPSLVQCLRGGGYTIFWRHADADVCTDRIDLGKADTTHVPDWWRSCNANCPTATARQMNAAGVQHATYIGDQISALGIPVGRVISSEYCRCFATAQLMDFGPTIELDSGISFYVYDEENRCAHSYAFIEEAPAQGTNTAIIGHGGFPTLCTTLSALQWSECAIFKPDGLGGALLITRLTWDAWDLPTVDVTPGPVAVQGLSVDAFEVAEGVRIRYHLESAHSAAVQLDILDVQGRRVWSLKTEPQGAGSFEETWDGRDPKGRRVQRGVYFVRLETGTARGSCKLTILGR